jgi:subtilisin family serine protease
MARATAAALLLALAALARAQPHFEFARPAKPSFAYDLAADAPPSGKILVKAARGAPRPQPLDGAPRDDFGISCVEAPAGEPALRARLAKLAAEPGVAYATRDTALWAAAAEAPPVDDREYRFQWALPRVGAPAAWAALASLPPARRVTVCVIDSGVDAAHPDLAANLAPGGDVTDALEHGTHVAGSVAAVGNNSVGVAGVALEGVNVRACKFLTAEGYGWVSGAVACIATCLREGADVINSSWAGGEANPALRDGIAAAGAADVLFVAAAGNSGLDLDTSAGANGTGVFPAAFARDMPNMLVVASTSYEDQLSDFSNYGAGVVALAAPGEWILSTVPGNKTAYFSGTSMAAPHVAAAAALVLAVSPKRPSAAELKALLLATAEPLESLRGKVSSGGLLRVDRALAAVAAAAAPRAAPRRAHRRMLLETVHT